MSVGDELQPTICADGAPALSAQSTTPHAPQTTVNAHNATAVAALLRSVPAAPRLGFLLSLIGASFERSAPGRLRGAGALVRWFRCGLWGRVAHRPPGQSRPGQASTQVQEEREHHDLRLPGGSPPVPELDQQPGQLRPGGPFGRLEPSQRLERTVDTA